MNRATSFSWRATEAGGSPSRTRRLAGWPAGRFAVAGACIYVAVSGLPGVANLALLLLVLASALEAAAEPRPARPASALLPAVGLFGLSTLISTATSIDPARSLQLSIPLVPGALLFLLVSGLSPRYLRALCATFTAVSLVLAVYLLGVAWQDPWAGPVAWTDAIDLPFFVVRNDVAFFAALLPLALALALDPSRLGLSTLGAVAVVADVAVVVLYQSRGAVLATLLGLGAWALAVRGRAATVVAGGAVLTMLGIDAASGFPLAARAGEIWSTRINLWVTALDMFVDAPLLGLGPRSFAVLFGDYAGTVALPAWLPADPRFSPWAHNLWLETLAEQGIIGFGALLLLVALAARAGGRVARAAGEEVQRLGLGAAVALLVVCVEGIFELTLLRLWVVVVLFSLLGVLAALEMGEHDE